MGITASADKSMWNAAWDATSYKAARGKEKRGDATVDETMGRLRGDVSSVDETSSRTTV